MLRSGILNPDLLALLARFRHTNRLVIADRGFPFWPEVPTVDLSVVDDLPTVLQVLEPVLAATTVGSVRMAEEFLAENDRRTVKRFEKAIGKIPVTYEAHAALKRRVPGSVGLIRTGDTIQYANIVLESA